VDPTVLIIIGVIGWIAFKFFSSSKKTKKYNELVKKQNQEISQICELTTKVRRESIDFKGKKIDVFKIDAKGFWLRPGKTGNSGYFVTYIADQTDGIEYGVKSWPIKSTIETWAEEGSAVLCIKGEVMEAGEGIHYPDWANVGVVPFDLMEFPYKGKRKIAFTTFFCNPRMEFKHGIPNTQEFVLSHAIASKEINIEEIGYKEAIENRPRAMELTIKLGIAVASADDKITQDEIDEIKKWAGKQVELDFYGDETIIQEKKRYYGKYIKDTVDFAEKNRLSQTEISSEFKSLATRQQKYDAIELMLDVMVSDTDAGTEEMTIIDDVAPILGLEAQTVKDLRETRLSKVSSIGGSAGDSDDERLFGLTSSMSDEEKCHKLDDEYIVWHEKMALPDKKMSQRAKEMVDKIMSLRQTYKCK